VRNWRKINDIRKHDFQRVRKLLLNQAVTGPPKLV
jgi:hypothetical protein